MFTADKRIELNPQPITKELLENLEFRGLIKRFAAPQELLSVPEGECWVRDLYISSPTSGPHKLIAVACNRTSIPLGFHDQNEEFIIFAGSNRPNAKSNRKPLYLVVAIEKATQLKSRSESGTLTSADFVMLELAFNDPELSLFTMLKGTVHTELTAPGNGTPPVFYVTESRDISMETVSLSPFEIVPIF